MRERPILFSAPMVRALLAGEKTQTRRLADEKRVGADGKRDVRSHGRRFWPCKYGEPGDRIWVREAWREWGGTKKRIAYRATDTEVPNPADGWWSPIYMPRWASRITLELTDISVQRLQEISEEEARAEGITDGGCLNCGEPEPCGCAKPQPDARDAFIWLWNSINAKRAPWDSNPFVWALTFRRLTP